MKRIYLYYLLEQSDSQNPMDHVPRVFSLYPPTKLRHGLRGRQQF
jgi:hypothetical protein